MTVDLALYRVPNVRKRGSRLIQLVRPFLAPLRYRSLPDFAEPPVPSRLPDGDRALLLGFSPYMTRDIVAPVARALGRNSGLAPIVLGPRAPTDNGEPGIVYQAWSQHWNRRTQLRSKKLSKALRADLKYLRAVARTHDLFSGLEGTSRAAMVEKVMNTFAEYGGYILSRHAAVAEEVLDQVRPRVIISPDVADPRTRLYSLIGARRGIPTVEVQFGVFGPEATEWRFFHSAAVAVWGNHSRDVLARHGVPRSLIHVTGSPRHDSLAVMSADAKAELRRRFRVPPAEQMIVLASVYSLDAYQTKADLSVLQAMKRDALEVAGTTPGVRLVVKPHPLEDLSETATYAAKYPNIAFADPEEDVRDLINAADGVLTFGSTVTLDSLILNKPTVSIAYPGWHWGELFVEGGATEVCSDRSKVESVFGELSRGGGASLLARHALDRTRFLDEWIGGEPGMASGSIARLAVQLAFETAMPGEQPVVSSGES